MTAYYNEFDPYAAQWLRNLIAAGHIAPGEVDERSIVDVKAHELSGFTQCHFFAGIGGWSYALRLAGWGDERPAWTGSCPCQPLSSAGQKKGDADERHLWPAFFELIDQCEPTVIFGEQVASADGREWFAAVRADLESVGHASGALDLCAAGVGAPHIRQRLHWVADANSGRRKDENSRLETTPLIGMGSGPPGKLAHPDINKQRQGGDTGSQKGKRLRSEPGGCGVDRRKPAAGAVGEHWRNPDWLFCTDGKWRPVEPGTFPLADGVSARVGRLRAYGNAIVPQVAAEFIAAFMEVRP